MRAKIILLFLGLVAITLSFVGNAQAALPEDQPKGPAILHSLAGGDSILIDTTGLVCTWWRQLWRCGNLYHVIDYRDNNDGVISACDYIKTEMTEAYGVPQDPPYVSWKHIERVTATLKLRKIGFSDSMFVEFSGGLHPDSLNRMLFTPVCTWWHEVWPEECVWWHVYSWIDNGDGHLSTCDSIGLTTGDYPAISFTPSPVLADEARSTTGPVPPPGTDRGMRPVTRQQVTIPGVPSYVWHHGCGPTAVGMVVGYWDGNGFPDLVPGSAGTQTAAVDAMIADDSGNPDCDAPDGDHYQDYSCPIDTPPNLLPDRSQTGGAHASNCVGDFFETSWSLAGSYYGWSWYSDVPGSFTGYVNWVAPHYSAIAVNETFAQLGWAAYKAEIDAGCPVVLLVDTDGDGSTDHFVTGIGYNNTTMEYGIYDTWDNAIHWYAWRGMAPGNTWGVFGITLFRILFKWHVEDIATDIEVITKAPPSDIPTTTEWGLIVLAALLVASAVFVYLRRKRVMVSR